MPHRSPHNVISHSETFVSHVKKILVTCRDAKRASVSLSATLLRDYITRINQLRVSAALADSTRQALTARITDTLLTLRSAYYEAVRFSNTTGERPPTGLHEYFGTASGYTETELARVLPDVILRFKASARHLSDEMVATYLWHAGRSVARLRITTFRDTLFVSRTGASFRLPSLNNLELSLAASAERLAAYNARYPEVLYRPACLIPDTVWPHYMSVPSTCSACGMSTMNTSVPLHELSAQRNAAGQTYCMECVRTADACGLCEQPSPSLHTTQTVPDGLAGPYRASNLIRGPRICQSCLNTSAMVAHGDVFIPRHVHRQFISAQFVSYSFQPVYRINAHANERLTPASLCFGVELECGHTFSATAQQRILDDIAAEDIYFKHDGSIVGFEMVSHPFTWRYWNASGRDLWTERLKKIQAHGVRSYNAPNCGMHVHMSLAAFSVAQTVRLLDLVYGTPDLFQRISQRDVFDYCRFDNGDIMTAAKRRARAVAAHKQKLLTNNYTSTSRMRLLAARAAHNGERRVAINFPNNKPTLEVRMFRGTLHAPSFAKNIEVCHALHAFTELSTGNALSAARDFVEFAYDNERTYPNLSAFLDRWHKNLRPQRRVAPPQYAVVRTTPRFEFDSTVATQS